jgi:uncharacterized protein (TIGR02996 family)
LWRAADGILSGGGKRILFHATNPEAAMHDEDDFLRKLSESPADDTVRMIYADWLDERDDEESKSKARFLRITVQLMGPIRRIGWRKPRENELHQLAATLPTDWLAVVSRPKVESCPVARAQALTDEALARHGVRFNVVCDKRWDELTPTGDQKVRHCAACNKDVHYCDTIDAARDHAHRGECIAVSLGVRRHGDDLEQVIVQRLGGAGII